MGCLLELKILKGVIGKMQYIKLIGVCLMAIFGACILTTSAAAAEDIYRIEGIELEAGETVGITASAKTEFSLKSKGALEIEAVVKCKKLKLKESEGPEIIGGDPGTSAKEVIEFEECSATVGGSKCSSVEITNAPMNNELVTVRAPSGLSGKLATLFTPVSGKELLKIKLNKCGIFGSQAATVEGTTAAVTSPEGVFEPEGEWAWNEKEEITEIEKHNGTKGTVGLTSDGKKSTLEGVAKVPPPAESIVILPNPMRIPNIAGEEESFVIKNLGTKAVEIVEQKLGGPGKAEYEDKKECLNVKRKKSEVCNDKIKLQNANAKEALFEGKVSFEGGGQNLAFKAKKVEVL
jgi:hypothetical protein